MDQNDNNNNDADDEDDDDDDDEDDDEIIWRKIVPKSQRKFKKEKNFFWFSLKMVNID